MPVRPVRLLLVGLGNLGRRFCALLGKRETDLARRYGLRFLLVGAADSRGAAERPDGLDLRRVVALKEAGKSIAAYLGVGRPDRTALDLVREAEADVLCEASPVNLTAGGEPGLSCVRAALSRGMHVVTTNKGPIVLAYPELVRLARDRGVELRFDGTVAGGLPALYLGLRDLRGAIVSRIEAVPNLVTGLLIDRLLAGGAWEEAVAQARREGQLEADPSWDLDGWDAAAKLVILANAVLCVPAHLEDVKREGITGLTAEGARRAAGGGLLRLVARAERVAEGSYRLSVRPRSLPPEHPLGRLGTHGMGIVYETDLYGTIAATIDETTPLPSAATILRDLLDIYVGREDSASSGVGSRG